MIEQDSDYALLTEIAVAYYDQEQTQEEIAKRFGISRIKVGRLLKKARQEGIVEISVKYHPVFSSQIEQQFISHFGIKRALIALDHHDEDEQRQQVAALVSNYLAGVLKNDMTVTVGQGRNVAAVANHVGVFPERHCRFICGIGGTARAVLKIANQYLEKPESNRLYSSNRHYCYAPVIGNPILYFVSCGNYTTIGFAVISNYLATINNLSEPVTKTADKTMKVTYIIQEQ